MRLSSTDGEVDWDCVDVIHSSLKYDDEITQVFDRFEWFDQLTRKVECHRLQFCNIYCLAFPVDPFQNLNINKVTKSDII